MNTRVAFAETALVRTHVAQFQKRFHPDDKLSAVSNVRQNCRNVLKKARTSAKCGWRLTLNSSVLTSYCHIHFTVRLNAVCPAVASIVVGSTVAPIPLHRNRLTCA